ncbi:MAG TPA: IPTL-CTERM sorting domain-containing protein [Thermoanaerobaculia bacterium]|nr:IPTL-CTERM sorting domain-containing protein [Thermoanaerobaculia bacterium]
MFLIAFRAATFFILALVAGPALAQPLAKSAIQVDPGNTKQTGQTFAYRLTYNCSSTSGPCLNAEVVDLLPAEVQFLSTVPASPTGDVSAINVTPNFMGSGRTRVQFVMDTPLTAGNSGDLLINVRFPAGSTADGTVATNTADGINLGTAPGTFTTPPVNVTAVATVQVGLQKTLTTGPANLDMPETYRLRISVPNNPGALNLTAIGPVVDTLHPGTVFNGATPAADCQPGCVGTTPATVTWTSPCSMPLTPGGNCDIFVNVTFPSGTFPSGTNITNEFTADATPLGEPPQTFGPVGVTHPVTTFVPAPGAGFTKNMAGGTPNPPTLNQTFSYDLNVNNNGNVPLDNMVVIDTLPVEMQVLSVTTGAYNNLTDFAVGEGVRVSYEKNTALGVFTLWGSSPNTTTNTTLTAPPPGLGAGEYLTRIRWEYGQAQVGMNSSARPVITGRIVNPDNAGGPVAIGDPIQNCADLSAVYTPGPTNVVRNDCESFNVSGPFVQLNPAKENLSGGGPFNPGQSVSYRLRVRSAPQSSDPVPLEDLVATDLLPVNLLFVSWVFDDQSTGLPAPQVFDQIPNFAGTGRTLLRWRWNAGSGNLGVNQQVWINITVTIRNGAPFGSLGNDFTLEHDNPGLGQRCSTPSQTDPLDLDEDADTAETLCRESETVTVAGIAQLVSSKTIQGTCDGGSVSTSAGTLTGGALEYRLRVQNVGTVAMQNFVLIDILPFVGDTGVRDTNPRGSLWTPLLAAPITPPPGTVIYYSTSGNPCRGEVGGPTTSCDPPNWTTVPPDPITSVRSFKVEFGSLVVDPFDFVEFFFSMVTPGDIPPGDPAFNSFAYQADRADGLGSLAAEPQKVGVALGSCDAARLGDFVWVDVNSDGVQNDGPTGLNGVYTRLFAPGPDGLPGTLDDVPLSSTLTANGPDSAPGWYSFPGLAPGSYLVCFTPPPTFVVTTANQGADTADSDINPATACTPVVTLAANEDNPTLDAGLVATELAALGNYVWFDRDGNGLQDESPFDGANGVTVRLWVDDGDGNPEPGTGDALAATTVTTDDVYGQPGYYLFDGLIPGLRYFVELVLPASATGFTSQDTGGDDTVDSDAAPNGVTPNVILAPSEVNLTLDAGLVTATGTLALGDQVWFDTDNDGVFEPQDGELGIDNVRLNLYLDDNGDGQPTLDEYLATTTTLTQSGFAGRYLFGNLAPGTYIVVVAPQSFAGGGALAGLVTSTGNDPAPDPDDDVNGDDNGTDVGALTASRPVTLTDNGEPTAEDGNNDTNLTVDFGFINGETADTPDYDYGDDPDVVSGTAPGDYNTTALDNGAYHRVDVAGSPYLGACVDADGGFNQDVLASQDDTGSFGPVFGTCAGGDDEDGVTFTGPFVPGSVANFSVTAGGPSDCVLNAWVDWDHSGVFGDSAGEQVATDLSLPPGPPAVLSPAVPVGAIPGLTYARFRCSVEPVEPTGFGLNGEVEDYLLAVVGTDFGDAPDTYETQGAGAASHTIDPLATLLLGSCVDTEADGQPDAPATGDDNSAGTSRVGNCFDDEDGVAFGSALLACQSAPVTVSASGISGSGLLDAWIDFNADGDFGDPGEQVFSDQPLAAGANPLSLIVPCTAVESPTYARFRLSSTGTAGSAGPADDGEVEDYAVNIGDVDLGDAPDTYGTLVASNGPNHGTTAGFSLGATVDSETDGQPSAGATGDGADEDGVTLPPGGFVACSAANVSVFLTNTAGVATPRLDAWVDFDGDGVFGDPRDRVATSLALVAGGNALVVNVPCDAASAFSYARFRLSSTGVAGPGGPAADGEIEDWAVTAFGLDFGDAPDPTYPTLLASNGARHTVLPAANPTLGSTVDTEANGQPNAGLTGDDTAGADDENGVILPPELIPGTNGSIQLTTGATGGIVSCWIDFNQNESWLDAGEQVVTDDAIAASTVASRSFPVPVGSPQGTAPVRCRISSQSGLGVTGQAPDGEIEDHPAAVGVELPEIGVAKRLVSVTRLGGTFYDVVFEIRVANLGNVPLNGVQVTEDLDVTFADAASFTVQSLTSPDLTVNPGFDGSGNTALLAAGNTLTVGGSGTITLTLRVDSGGNQGPYTNQVQASGTSPGSQIVTDISQDGDDVDPDDDGDPTDNSEPTVFALPFALIEIPTVGEWGLMILAMLLALVAVWRLRS